MPRVRCLSTLDIAQGRTSLDLGLADRRASADDYTGNKHTKNRHPIPMLKLKFLILPGIEPRKQEWKTGTLPITPRGGPSNY